MTSIHEQEGISRLARRAKLDPYRLRRLRSAFYKTGFQRDAALAELPEPARATFADEVEFHALKLEQRHDSKLDGASKLLFRTQSGELIETVILRIATGRTSLCVSSQSGCAAGCAFCATGKLGFRQNLSAAEICDQVMQAAQVLHGEGRKVRNLVFMGMGEPFHNERSLHSAIEVLTAKDHFNFNFNRVLVSTVGVAEAMVRCVEKFPRIGLALSLHSAVPETRLRLIPLAKKHSLEDIREAVKAVTSKPDQQVMIEYTMLDGINDTEAELTALIDWLTGLPVHVNLIPYNRLPGVDALSPSPKARIEAFAKSLKAAGFKVTIRYSLGADIAAACGTLAAKESPAILSSAPH